MDTTGTLEAAQKTMSRTQSGGIPAWVLISHYCWQAGSSSQVCMLFGTYLGTCQGTRRPKKSSQICQAANSISNYYPNTIQPLILGKVNIKVFTSAPDLGRLCADTATRDSCQCQAARSPASRARRVSRCNILPTQQSMEPHHRIAVAMWYCSVVPIIRFR